MARALTIEEQSVAAAYREVADESKADAAKFSLATCALRALTGGLSEETQLEVFSSIRRQQGIEEPLDRAAKLALLSELGQAEELVATYEERANGGIANELAEQVETHGLPK